MALRIETFEDEFGPLLVIIYFQLYNFLLKKNMLIRSFLFSLSLCLKMIKKANDLPIIKRETVLKGSNPNLRTKVYHFIFSIYWNPAKKPCNYVWRHINLDVIAEIMGSLCYVTITKSWRDQSRTYKQRFFTTSSFCIKTKRTKKDLKSIIKSYKC